MYPDQHSLDDRGRPNRKKKSAAERVGEREERLGPRRRCRWQMQMAIWLVGRIYCSIAGQSTAQQSSAGDG